MSAAENCRGNPVTKTKPRLEQRGLPPGNSERSQRHHRRELQQFAAIHAFELELVGFQGHKSRLRSRFSRTKNEIPQGPKGFGEVMVRQLNKVLHSGDGYNLSA